MSFENSKTHIRNLGSLVSEVPNLLGFVPENSLVLLGVTRNDVPLAMRTDLPATAHRRTVADYLISTVVEQIQAELVIAVAVGQQDHELCNVLETSCHRSRIGLHAVWTPALRPGKRWFCVHDPDCQGPVYDTSSSPLAAATAAAGFRTYDSRHELEATIAPVADTVRNDLARRLQHWQSRTQPAQSLREAAAPVLDALNRLRGGERLETEHIVAALGTMHRHKNVRDYLFTIQEPAAAQLWTTLLRHAPDTYIADVAALLAVSAQLRGDGALANMALNRALTATPTHRLATLLKTMLRVPPEHLRGLVEDLAADPKLQLT